MAAVLIEAPVPHEADVVSRHAHRHFHQHETELGGDAARELLGDDFGLAVDTNANYTVDVALDSMRRIAPYRIDWFEEPLKPHDYRGYAELKARAPMPIATGQGNLPCAANVAASGPRP